MTGSAQYIFPLVMALLMAFMVTGMVSFIHAGLSIEFFSIWFAAFIIVWPCASLAVFIALPIARLITPKIAMPVDNRLKNKIRPS